MRKTEVITRLSAAGLEDDSLTQFEAPDSPGITVARIDGANPKGFGVLQSQVFEGFLTHAAAEIPEDIDLSSEHFGSLRGKIQEFFAQTGQASFLEAVRQQNAEREKAVLARLRELELQAANKNPDK